MSIDSGTLQVPQPGPVEEAGPEPRGGAWKVLSILLALVAVPLYVLGNALELSQELATDGGVYLPFLLGSVLGLLLMPLLFVLVARVFARPYSKRTFWKAYCIGMLFCALTAVSTFTSAAVEHARGKADAMRVAEAEAEWVPYLSTDGGFRVEMPGTPEPAEVPDVPDGVGVKLVKMNRVFTVAVMPMYDLELHPLEFFTVVADEYRASYGAEVEESAVFHAGMVGRELRMKWPDGQDMVSRLYMKDGVYYETLVGGPALDENLVGRFLDSFELATPES